jgi:hypothetical protein
MTLTFLAGVGPDVPGAGVWMSGGGLASDGKGSMFFATGNGYASQLNGVPVNGRNPPTSLEEAAVHMSIDDDGSLTIVDFFMPWEKVQLDGADKGKRFANQGEENANWKRPWDIAFRTSSRPILMWQHHTDGRGDW